MSCESVVSVLLDPTLYSPSFHLVLHKAADLSVFVHQDLCVFSIRIVSGLFYFRLGMFPYHYENQALSLQQESSPCAAVWDSGLYRAKSRINQMNPRPTPITLRCVSKCPLPQQRAAEMSPDVVREGLVGTDLHHWSLHNGLSLHNDYSSPVFWATLPCLSMWCYY